MGGADLFGGSMSVGVSANNIRDFSSCRCPRLEKKCILGLEKSECASEEFLCVRETLSIDGGGRCRGSWFMVHGHGHGAENIFSDNSLRFETQQLSPPGTIIDDRCGCGVEAAGGGEGGEGDRRRRRMKEEEDVGARGMTG